MSSIVADNHSESRDCESQEGIVAISSGNDGQNAPDTTSSGYYDANKCRAYMAIQARVSKIDRFATQVMRAVEVEADVHSRLSNLLTMFVRRSIAVATDFTLKCKLGFQHHRQDRILNYSIKPGPKKKLTAPSRSSEKTRAYSISNDLLYGKGAQLVQTLLSQAIMTIPHKHIKRKADSTQFESYDIEVEPMKHNEMSEDRLQADQIDPAIFVKKLEDCMRGNLSKSKTINAQLNSIRQIFERLASEHRDKVDLVYAAEEERQATTVVRRSAYNLSMAAIKATSTPVHVNTNTST